MKCFVIMPFAQDFAPVYEDIRLAVESAVTTEPLSCTRLDDDARAGRISDRLVRELSDSSICVADITGTNPNVMWEIGYAMALDKPTLLISQDRQGLPFDLKDMQTVFYDRAAMGPAFREPLGRAIRDTLGAFGNRAQKLQGHLAGGEQFTIAITGSKQAHEKHIRRELALLLAPHLDKQVRWLVGSWGATDETALRYLIEHNQKPTVVGNDQFDVSPATLGLIEAHGLVFVAASQEAIPRAIPGGRPRDVFFLIRAHLVCLLWSGRSSRIKDLMRWYRDNKKNHTVGFV